MAKTQGRSWRFSMRWLLLFVLIAAVPCGWYADRLRRQRQERQAIASSLHQQHVVLYIINQEWGNSPQASVPPGAIPPKLPAHVLRQGNRGHDWSMISRTELSPELVAPGTPTWQQVRIKGGWDRSGARPILIEVSGFEGEPQSLPHLRAAFGKEGWPYRVTRLAESASDHRTATPDNGPPAAEHPRSRPGRSAR